MAVLPPQLPSELEPLQMAKGPMDLPTSPSQSDVSPEAAQSLTAQLLIAWSAGSVGE